MQGHKPAGLHRRAKEGSISMALKNDGLLEPGAQHVEKMQSTLISHISFKDSPETVNSTRLLRRA
jgi:hypothetical protein